MWCLKIWGYVVHNRGTGAWHDVNTYRHWWTLQWRYNERNGISNHRRLECLLNRLSRCTLRKCLVNISKTDDVPRKNTVKTVPWGYTEKFTSPLKSVIKFGAHSMMLRKLYRYNTMCISNELKHIRKPGLKREHTAIWWKYWCPWWLKPFFQHAPFNNQAYYGKCALLS